MTNKRLKVTLWLLLFPPVMAGIAAVIRNLTPRQSTPLPGWFELAVAILMVCFMVYNARKQSGQR